MLISESTWERKAHPVQRNQNLTVEMLFKEIGISMSHIVSLTSKKQEKKVSLKKWMWIHSCVSCHKLVLLSSAPEKKNSVPFNMVHKKGLSFFACCCYNKVINDVSSHCIGINEAFKGFQNKLHEFITNTYWPSSDGKSQHTCPLKVNTSLLSGAGWSRWMASSCWPTTSCLSTTIRPICPQFPHSSSVPSEVHCDRFPTPPQLSYAPHCTYTAASFALSRVEHIHRTNYPVHPHIHAHTQARMHTIAHRTSNKFHHEAKAERHPWGGC